MINPIVQGRDRATSVAGTTRAWYARQRRFPGSQHADNHALLSGVHSIDQGTLFRSSKPDHPLLPFLKLNPNTRLRQPASDERDLALSTPHRRGYVAACLAWLQKRRRARRPVLDAKLALSDVLEILPVPAVAVDDRNQIVFANARAIELFGYTRDELVGASTRILFPMFGESEGRLAINECCAAGKAGGAETSQVLVARRRNGGGFSATANVTECRMRGQLLQVMTITERSARSDVDGSQNELAHLSRVSSLGELAGSLAHELNQPLTAILSNAQAAQYFVDAQTLNKAELNGALTDIVAANRRACDVIQKIRTLVRKGNIELQPLDIGYVVRDVALLVHSDAMVRGVDATFDIAGNLPMVCGDGVQLQQVLLNLLLNGFDAVKECSGSERAVELTVREDTGAGVHIMVRDHGTGLATNNMDKIFRPFFTTKPQGLGLGLSISHTIVTAHGGRLWAENNDGKGATFHIALPRGRTVQESLGGQSS